jgi:protein-histidine pros-kinase
MRGLRAKFNLVILVTFAVGFLLAAIVLKSIFINNAREQTLQNARIIIETANAIRKYTVRELGSLLPKDLGGQFVPQTVPAYAAQKTFKDLQADFAGYSYREPALNPTNLSDKAQFWEADIIDMFRNAPAKKELVFDRDTPFGPTLNLARPISVGDNKACLICHGTPAEAPPVLTKEYGTGNGFGWKLNETIGAQIVSLPMSVPLKLARDAYVTFLVTLVATFAIVFTIMNLFVHYLVLVPVTRLSAIADAVSQGEEDIEIYVKPGKDELSSLSVSFNRMRESLKRAMEMIK